MKKLTCLLLAVLLVLSLAACKPPVDGPGMENTTPTTEPAATEPTEFTVPTDLEPTDPSVEEKPDLNLYIYEGIYQLEGEDAEADSHILEVINHGDFLTMEHGLYQEGSLYAFWVEEFWPNEDEVFTDLYDARKGKVQTFSVQTDDTAYEQAPAAVAVLYNDSGIAIQRGTDGEREYYLLCEDPSGIHTDAATLAQQLQQQEPVTLEESLVGIWTSWSGYCYSYVNFAEDGTFTWLHKEQGKPVEFYRGAWGISEAGTIAIMTERLGSGTMPYVTHMTWTFDETEKALILSEDVPLLLHEYGDYMYPYDPAEIVDLRQSNALTYTKEVWGISDEYQATDGNTYYYNFNLPEFYGSSDAVIALNEDIRQQFGTLIEKGYEDVLAGKALTWNDFLWEAFSMGDVVAVKLTAYQESGEEQLMVYYYDTAADTRLYAADALTAAGIDETMYLDGLKAQAQEAFRLYYGDRGWEEDAHLAWSLSDDNLNTACPFVIQEDGTVVTYVQLETPEGTCWEIVFPFGAVDPDAAG